MSKSDDILGGLLALGAFAVLATVWIFRATYFILFFVAFTGWYSPDAIDLTSEYLGFVPEFWTGTYHGATVLPNLIREIWCDPARIYAANHGGFYEMGYAISVLGLLSFSSSSDKK